jgi:hypothetical protein
MGLRMNKRLDVFDIYIKYPGIGDSLFYSHIPKLAKGLGYERVRVHVPAAIFSQEKTDLIWRLNPFVDEVVENSEERNSVVGVRRGVPLLDSIAMDLGLSSEVQNFEPEIYYQPKNSYEGKVVYDGNFISGAGLINTELIRNKMRAEKELVCLRPLSSKYISSGRCNDGYLSLNSLADYFDVLSSADRFYCVVSGGASLRPAFGKKSTVFYGVGQCAEHRHSQLNDYVDVSIKFWPGLEFLGAQLYRVFRKLQVNKT